MYLPKKYLDRMEQLLGSEFEEFMRSYEKKRFYGLRVNTLKISIEDFKKISPFKLIPIPWCKDGFYFEEGQRPAKDPYYHAGLYYIQEPSAMAPGEILDVEPSDRVLDLCAAPGGKSMQISAALKGEGVLITNDINLNRVKALIKNVELFGIKNAMVTNENPEKLKRYFESFFNKILVDAPCSGEGMFRKDKGLIKSWENHGATYYSHIQKEIMTHVPGMLNTGGKLLYSTCTFSPEENEEVIMEVIKENEDMDLIDIQKQHGFSSGKPEWIEGGEEKLKRCARLWPHKLEGEGHFLSLMEKIGQDREDLVSQKERSKEKPPKEFFDFVKDNLNMSIDGEFEIYNDRLYLIPEGLPKLKGLKLLRSGWLLGTHKKNRFEPSHALAMAIAYTDAKRILNFGRDDVEVIKYLKGETLNIGGEKGWTLVCVDNYPLGWGKQTGKMLKNSYPPSWRWLA